MSTKSPVAEMGSLKKTAATMGFTVTGPTMKQVRIGGDSTETVALYRLEYGEYDSVQTAAWITRWEGQWAMFFEDRPSVNGSIRRLATMVADEAGVALPSGWIQVRQ